MRGRLLAGAAFSGVVHVGLLLAASTWVLQVGRPVVPPPIPVSLLVLPALSPPPAVAPEVTRPAPPPVVPPRPLPDVAAPAPPKAPSPPAPVEPAAAPPPVAEAVPEPLVVPGISPPALEEVLAPPTVPGMPVAPAAPVTETGEAGGGSPAGTGVGAPFAPAAPGPGIALAPGGGGVGPGAPGSGGTATPAPPVPVLPLSPPRPLVGINQRPTYPETARRAGIEGTTRLKILVRADGSVGAVEVAASAGDPSLDAAAVSAARTWRFEPARRGANPVAVWILRDVEFRLE